MIHPERYDSLGELLRDALIQYKGETALIEVNRKREAHRLRYLEMLRLGARLARQLQDLGVGAGTRVAIVMSNQARWLLGAYAAFYRGAIVVPIDYKLTAVEQRALLRHARVSLLLTQYPEWRKLGLKAPCETVLVSEMPTDAETGGAIDWAIELPPGRDPVSPEATSEPAEDEGPGVAFVEPDFVSRDRDEIATIVYSSGTGGDPKGCLLSHRAYLEQLRSLAEVFPLSCGDRFFSILPTNHAIDFMCGFIGPLASGATVVHQRALRPELIRHTMQRYAITHMAVVPLILEAFEQSIRERLDATRGPQRLVFEGLQRLSAALTRKEARPQLSRALLAPIHRAFGGSLRVLFCGGAFVNPDRARFFYELGLSVAIGYGLTEACTVLTVNDLRPFRADSVGRALSNVQIEIRHADAHGVGEVWVRSPTLMQGYLDDPERSAEVLVEGWLKTGDVGLIDPSGHLKLVGRRKNMVVTAGGKNIYPEDIESAFDGLACDELAVFATSFLWPGVALEDEKLVAVLRSNGRSLDELARVNRRLPDFKRVSGVLRWSEPFPRTASLKIKRGALADAIRRESTPDAIELL